MYPPFDPLIHLGPLTLHWYGVIMTVAIFLGALVASRFVESRGQDPTTLWDMLLWVLIPAIIGARLYYVFIQSPRTNAPGGIGDYLAHPIEILKIWNGGIHIYGALIFGAIALFLYARWRKLPLLTYLDGIGLGLLLGQCIGRLGNFMNQELYGPPTTLPWGLRIDQDHRVAQYSDMTRYPDSTRFQPLFLYEMTWDGIGFLLLSFIAIRYKKALRPGDLALLYLIWAPLGRFFIEFFRSDSWFFPGTPFNLVHLLTAGAVILAAVTLIVRFARRRGAPAAQKSDIVEVDEDDIQGTTPIAAGSAQLDTSSSPGNDETSAPASTLAIDPVPSDAPASAEAHAAVNGTSADEVDPLEAGSNQPE